MIHQPTPSQIRNANGNAIDAGLIPDFAPSRHVIHDSFRQTMAAAADPVYFIIRRLNRPIIVRAFTYWQTELQSGFENLDVIFEPSDKTTHPLNQGARLLSGGANFFGAFRPTTVPTTITFNLPIRIAPLIIKFLFRSSTYGSNTMMSQLTFELA
jgi:hypothetical protein